MAAACLPGCLLPMEDARRLACRPSFGAGMVGGGETASLRLTLSVSASGESARRELRFTGPVLIVGMTIDVSILGDDGFDVQKTLGVKLDDGQRVTLVGPVGDGDPQFAPASAMCLPLRHLGILLEGSDPKLGVTVRPHGAFPDGDWPPLDVVAGFVYYRIGG